MGVVTQIEDLNNTSPLVKGACQRKLTEGLYYLPNISINLTYDYNSVSFLTLPQDTGRLPFLARMASMNAFSLLSLFKEIWYLSS